ASEAHKAAILDSAHDAIIDMDHEGRIVGFNATAERIFGHRREDTLGKEVGGLLLPAALREAHRRGLERYLRTGESSILGRRVEFTAMRADGSEFPVELSVIRVAPGGKPVFTGIVRDITLRKRAEQALRE